MVKDVRKLGVLAALVALFAFACTTNPPPRVLPQHSDHITLRPIGMDSTAFVRAADDLLARKAPRWHNPNVQVRLGFGLLDKYGVTDKDELGNIYIVLGRPALVLATIEDLAAVLLHEYVHVTHWDYVFDNPSFEKATYACKRARAEMLANKVVVEVYHDLGYRRDMLRHQIALYQSAYGYARTMLCPTEITIDLPKFVRPLNFKGRSITVPELEQPDYTPGKNREEYLDPWEDPNKTSPLYKYSGDKE